MINMKTILKFAFILFVIINISALDSFAGWQIGIESGMVTPGYNDVQIPKETGTRFSLKDDIPADSREYFRFTAAYDFDDRHHVGLLIAPLSLNAEGPAPKIITFEGVDFPMNSQIKAQYKFNSYRLTYRYRVFKSEKFTAGIGFTGKIRDAAIRLESDNLKSEKTNVGFVPLLNFSLNYALTDKMNFLFEGDALAAPQGRAEDVLAALQYDLNKTIGMHAGYRILEGGADVDEVYNFALLHYISFGIAFRF